MAETIISPGVFTRENDISFIQPAPVVAGASIIGPTVKGPVEVPTLVTSYNDYVRKFGVVFASGSTSHEFLTSVAVKNYFQQGGGSVLVNRVVSGSFTRAANTTIFNTNESGILETSADALLPSIQANTATGGPDTYTGVASATAGVSSTAAFTVIVSGSTAPEVTSITATTAGSGYAIGDTVTIAAGALGTGQLITGQNILSISNGASYSLGSVVGAKVVAMSSTDGSGTLSTFTVTGDGTNVSALTVLNIGTDHAAGNVITITNTALEAAGFTGASGNLTITLGSGTTNVQNSTAVTFTLQADDIVSDIPFTLETLGKGEIYNNSTLASDPGKQNSDSSLMSGSADNVRWEVSNVNTSQGTFTLSVRQGDDSLKNKTVLETFNDVSLDPNSSNYIEQVIGTQVQGITTDGDGSKYVQLTGEYQNQSNYIRVSSVISPTLNYLGTDGLTVEVDSEGASYSASLPVVSSGSFHGATGTNVKSEFGGDNGYFGNISNTVTQGLQAETDYADIISVLGNQEEYTFNVISAPGLIYEFANHKTQLDSIISLAETRGDCIAVVDLVNYGDTVSNATTKAGLINSSYAASYWPWLQTQSATGRNEWIPASVVIPGVYAFTDNSSAPWFAPAGLVRGGITGVIQAERRLTRTQRDTLYSKKVNPIASFPGQGISVFGQKTLQTKASALDRVNVRRLLIELKKFIGDQARTLVFEQNTIATRNRFLATVNPYLESVVQRQGLYAYRVVMDDSNNTADVVDRNQLIGQIFIQPAKTAEFVVLDFTIEPTGATFAG
tara:strand:+ start:133 stop:2493 length:2361 start_codon:yes stop_codon:yes gene_type:complete